MKEYYQDDLAFVHHNGFAEFAQQAGENILKLLVASGIQQGHVYDLGCGTGILAHKLAHHGYDVTAVDTSSAMLAIARQTKSGVNFVNASVYDIAIENCVAVIAIGEIFSYRLKSETDDNSLQGLFERIYKSLSPGGLLLFDVMAASAGYKPLYQSWKQGEDWAVLVATHEDHSHCCITREITVFRNVNGCFRRSKESHRVQIFAAKDVTKWLEAAGFRVRIHDGYGKFKLAPGRLAFNAIR